jgi:hypothetical protein
VELHERVIEELRSMAGRRKRLLAAECADAVLEVAPQLRYDPDRRRRLREVLSELSDIGELTWSASRDRRIRPELPAFVTLTDRPDEAHHKPTVPHLPWRPELEWAYKLRLSATERDVLAAVQAYRRDREPNADVIPHRERSLQLFGDEKRIDRLISGRLFRPDNLSLRDLDCFWAAPPIAWKDTGGVGPVVVSENAAGYHTLIRVLTGTARAVAYGAGSAFAQSVGSLARIDAVSSVLYIGDLDAEGLAIPQRAAPAAVAAGIPAPAPYEDLWSTLVDLADDYGQTVQPTPTEVAMELCVWFGCSDLRTAVQRLLEAGVRVPQEALTALRLHTTRPQDR